MKDDEAEPKERKTEKSVTETKEESMKQLNNTEHPANEMTRNENNNESHQEEELDDTQPANRGQEYNIRRHDNEPVCNFNCQSINNNTVESFDYRKTKIDQQNRISVLKEGRHYQEAMKKENTLKRQFSIHAEHDYHEKFSEDKMKTGERVGEVDSNEQSTCDNSSVSVVNGSDNDWDTTTKDLSDGGLSRQLIAYQLTETDVIKQKSNDEKNDVKEGLPINYNDSNIDYRCFYNDSYNKNNYYNNERELDHFRGNEYYPNFRSKSDVMFNDKDIALMNEQQDFYQNSSEFNNNEIVNSFLAPQDMLVIRGFQNQDVHNKNIDEIIADTCKNDDEYPYSLSYQNGSSPNDEASSNSSQDEKINSKILNLSNMKYSHNPRVTSVLTSTNSEYSGNYEQLSERIPIITSSELQFERSPSPNGQLQSLDSPSMSRGQAVPGVRYENSVLHTSATTVLQSLNPLTTSAPSGGVLQTLSPQRDMTNSDCDTQVSFS